MKTPEEIKKGLECCFSDRKCEKPEPCPYYFERGACDNLMMADAFEYIQQLESTVSEKEKVIAELLEKIEQLKREQEGER